VHIFIAEFKEIEKERLCIIAKYILTLKTSTYTLGCGPVGITNVRIEVNARI